MKKTKTGIEKLFPKGYKKEEDSAYWFAKMISNWIDKKRNKKR
ncbi:hypothetical protein [Tenacibaculum dicentrarchi]